MAGITSQSSITINASPKEVWDALINPEKVKQYLFGTNVESTWEKGANVTYKGEWQGKSYEDKGIVMEVVPEKLLTTTYWSSMSGLEDKPENYKTVKYELTPGEDGTILTITQDNNTTQEEAEHSQSNWMFVLEKLRSVVEKQ